MRGWLKLKKRTQMHPYSVVIVLSDHINGSVC